MTHDTSTPREKQWKQNLVRRTLLKEVGTAQVRATCNGYVKPPKWGVARHVQYFNHSTRTTSHES